MAACPVSFHKLVLAFVAPFSFVCREAVRSNTLSVQIPKGGPVWLILTFKKAD